MKKLVIIVIILISVSACSYLDFWTATKDDYSRYSGPTCPEVPECNIYEACLSEEDLRCLATQKQAYKTCIWVHEQSWELLNAK